NGRSFPTLRSLTSPDKSDQLQTRLFMLINKRYKMTQKLAFDRKRKLLLFLPLLVLPFAALAFHVLGDRAGDDEKSPSGFLRGLSTELPAAYFDKESPKTKWDYYQQAQKEAAAESIDTST